MRIVLKLLLLITLFMPAAGYAQENKPAKKFLDIIEVTSPGGIKAWLVEDHTIPVIALEFIRHIPHVPKFVMLRPLLVLIHPEKYCLHAYT